MNNKSWYAAKLSDMDVVRTYESNDFVVDYDRSRGMYRVTIFKDGHFWDEVWFDEYKEEDYSMQKAVNTRAATLLKDSYNTEGYAFEQIKAAIDDFNRMTADLAKSDKEMYEEEAIKMLTNWDKD